MIDVRQLCESCLGPIGRPLLQNRGNHSQRVLLGTNRRVTRLQPLLSDSLAFVARDVLLGKSLASVGADFRFRSCGLAVMLVRLVRVRLFPGRPWLVRCFVLLMAVALLHSVSFADVQMYRRDETHMGTRFEITLHAETKELADVAFAKAFKRIAVLDQLLSNYKPESEVNLLCKSSPHHWPQKVGADLMAVLVRSNALSQASDGAFDVTVGPLTKLWRRSRRQRELPQSERLQDAMKSVGYRHLHLDPHASTVRLAKSKTQIDLGGIAKGYAIDEALKVVTETGIASALVNGGGDLAASKAPPGREAWNVQIDTGDNRKAKLVLKISNQAVATSGNAFQSVEIDGTRYSHIVDPKSGLGLTHSLSVTIVAQNATLADGLASTVSVLGSVQGLKLVESRKDTEAYLATRKNDAEKNDAGAKDVVVAYEIEKSSGFERFLSR